VSGAAGIQKIKIIKENCPGLFPDYFLESMEPLGPVITFLIPEVFPAKLFIDRTLNRFIFLEVPRT
jgi:hypothetical protein